MEDRIFYVESPDGTVLGPMTMIQILEGIAAEALLESARICEVGRTDWVELSEVVSTREDAWEAPHQNGAEEHFPASSPVHTAEYEPHAAEYEPHAAGNEPHVTEYEPHAEEIAPPLEETPAVVETELVDTDLSERELHHIQTAALHEMEISQELGLDASSEMELAAINLHEDDIEEPVVISPDAYFSPLSMPVPEQNPDSGFPPVDETIDAGAPSFEAAELYDADATMVLSRDEMLEELVSAAEVSGGSDEPALSDSPEPFEHDPNFGMPRTLIDSGARKVPAELEPAIKRFNLEETVRFDGPISDHDEFEPIVIGDEHDEFSLDLPEETAAPLAREETAPPRRPRSSALAPVLAGLGAAAVLAIIFFGLHFVGRSKKAAAERDGASASDSSSQIVVPAPATESDRKKALAFLESGRERTAAQDFDGAIESLGQALELDPRLSEARAELARALAGGGRKSPAIDEMTKYLDEVPNDFAAQRERLDWMLATGKRAEAAMIYGTLAAEHRDSPDAQLMAGLASTEAADAETFLKRAADLDPQNQEIAATLAAAREKQGGSEKNAAESEKAVPPARTPEFAAVIREIRSQLEIENYDDARKEIDAARKKFGKDPEAARNLALWRGIADFEEGRYERAMKQFESLDASATYDASGWGRGSVSNWIARTCLAQGDYRAAALAFGVFDGADPDEIATAKLWEGVALQSLGMDELARRMWKQLPEEVGTLVQGSGKGAVKTAQYLSGVLGEKEYLQSVSSIEDFQNDMYYFLGRAAKGREDSAAALGHFRKSLESSRGREFPFSLAHKETSPAAESGDSDGAGSAAR